MAERQDLHHRQPDPRFISVTTLAGFLGVSTDHVRALIKRKVLRASRPVTAHYSDTRPRKTGQGWYRIYRDDVAAFLRTWRGGSVRLPTHFRKERRR